MKNQNIKTNRNQYKLATLLLLTFFLFLIPGQGEAQNERVAFYEKLINTVISGCDSKDFDTYDKAKYNIAAFLSTDFYTAIAKDSLISEEDRSRLLGKIINAKNTWFRQQEGTYLLIFYRPLHEGVIDIPLLIGYHKLEDGNVVLFIESSLIELVESVNLIAMNWYGKDINPYYLDIPWVDAPDLKYNGFNIKLTTEMQEEIFSRTHFFVNLMQAKDELFNTVLLQTRNLKEMIKKDEASQNKSNQE